MKTLSLAVGVLALGLGLAGPATAAVQPDTGIATKGCGEMRAAILGSVIDDLRSDYNRAAAMIL
ncbi:MAG TPA: hypothetical protein VEB64_07265, partial [Azospirillaceae bacterium]|nr:hypothetical protein [Azospirillaceae bacterium]